MFRPPPGSPGGKTTCPCCGAAGDAILLDTVPYRAIWGLLASEWDASFSEAVVRRHTPSPETSLLECRECGVHFFYPLVEGDPDFYRELGESPKYYNAWKWEFGWVRDRLSSGTAVLDVGCGKGDFLSHIKPMVRRAVGLERNPQAADDAILRGHEVVTCNLEEFARDHESSFDAACAFHVVEHLPAALPFLRALLSCLRPGGSAFVSLPNRERYWRMPLEPLDCPPHHLSRWSPAQLRKLAVLLDVPLGELVIEPVDIGMLREEMPARIRRKVEKVPGAGGFLGIWSTRILARTLFHEVPCSWYRRTGLFDRLGFHGMSMVARYVKPGF